MKNNIFADNAELKKLKENLAEGQKEVRKSNTDLYHVDPNDPNQRDHDSIERSSVNYEKSK